LRRPRPRLARRWDDHSQPFRVHARIMGPHQEPRWFRLGKAHRCAPNTHECEIMSTRLDCCGRAARALRSRRDHLSGSGTDRASCTDPSVRVVLVCHSIQEFRDDALPLGRASSRVLPQARSNASCNTGTQRLPPARCKCHEAPNSPAPPPLRLQMAGGGITCCTSRLRRGSAQGTTLCHPG
jgi:hypothetical protein